MDLVGKELRKRKVELGNAIKIIMLWPHFRKHCQIY